jgi:hypothetical protein
VTPTWGWLAVKGPIPGEIRVAGEVVGTTGTERFRMGAGRHEVEIVNEARGYRRRRVVSVLPGKVTTIVLETPAPGLVSVNASPWAEVWIGGRRIGETPLANVSVPAGSHEVIFRHPELGEKRQKISVAAGAPIRVAVDMK